MGFRFADKVLSVLSAIRAAGFFSRQREKALFKSEFLATISHELRTPLTAIIGFSELLMEGVMGELTEEQKECLGEVLHNSADLQRLINSLLDITKIEAGRMRLDVHEFDLTETVRRVCRSIAPFAEKKRQELQIKLPDGKLSVCGDERKIQRSISSLLANANKFTEEGGHIRVGVRSFGSWGEIRERAGWWRRPAKGADVFRSGCVEISVEDDGIGIQENQLDRVFEAFHQVDGGVTRSFGGTGVGLALARKFVEMHGGFIWAESELGKGAKFTAVLPLKSVNRES
ncbi:MAG: HAMP domain-containing sensor histidine kinase [Pseudomonadota bacterium]